MNRTEILKALAACLAKIFNTNYLIMATLSGDLSESLSVPLDKSPLLIWSSFLREVPDVPAAIKLIIHNIHPDRQASADLPRLASLCDRYELSFNVSEYRIKLRKGKFLQPVPLSEHAKKALLYASQGPTKLNAEDGLRQVLLEIGPLLAAHKTDFILLRNIEDLSRVQTAEMLGRSSESTIPVDVEAAARNVSVSIIQIRQAAKNSVELLDLRPIDRRSPFDPILVVLQCKLQNCDDSEDLPTAFVAAIREFEAALLRFNGSGEASLELKSQIRKLVPVAEKIASLLLTVVKTRSSHSAEACQQFLLTSSDVTTTLLTGLRPIVQSGTPSAPLWMRVAS